MFRQSLMADTQRWLEGPSDWILTPTPISLEVLGDYVKTLRRLAKAGVPKDYSRVHLKEPLELDQPAAEQGRFPISIERTARLDLRDAESVERFSNELQHLAREVREGRRNRRKRLLAKRP